jgi:hypothetical protein
MPKHQRDAKPRPGHPYRRQNSAPELAPRSRIRADVDDRNIIQGGTGLRSQRLKDLIPPPARHRGRNQRDLNFPSDYGAKSSVARGPMPAAISQDLNERTRNDPSSSSSTTARSVRSLADEDKTELQKNDASRNHILADSRIRTILDDVRSERQRQGGQLTGPQSNSLHGFITALTGPAAGASLQALEKAFTDAARDPLHSNAILKPVYDTIANGTENIRYGDSRTNSDLSNSVDYEVVDKRLSTRSVKVRDAVIELARNKLIEKARMFDSLGQVREKGTNLDVTSSTSSSSGLTGTGVRAQIDPFEAPVAESRFQRRASFSDLSTPPLDRQAHSETYEAPYRDWHHPTRPAARTKQAETDATMRPQ